MTEPGLPTSGQPQRPTDGMDETTTSYSPPPTERSRSAADPGWGTTRTPEHWFEPVRAPIGAGHRLAPAVPRDAAGARARGAGAEHSWCRCSRSPCSPPGSPRAAPTWRWRPPAGSIRRSLRRPASNTAVSPASNPVAGQASTQPLHIDESSAVTVAAEKTSPAIVTITTDLGKGSGIIYDARGWILTNRHVAIDAKASRSTSRTGAGSPAPSTASTR